MLKRGQIDLTTAVELAKNKIMSVMNCHNIGRIQTFYPETQTADIEIMQVKSIYNEFYNLPLLVNVPVIIYGGNNNGITLGDLTGAYCLLIFMDRNISSFLETGEIYNPNTSRMHDFSDCIALTTFKNNTNAISNYENEAINIYNNSKQSSSYVKTFVNNVEINSTQTIEQEGEETTNTSNFSVNPTSVLIENTGGGQVEVNAKINIENTSQNLAALMQDFLNACTNITVDTNTGALTPTSKQAFNNLATQFGELLQ